MVISKCFCCFCCCLALIAPSTVPMTPPPPLKLLSKYKWLTDWLSEWVSGCLSRVRSRISVQTFILAISCCLLLSVLLHVSCILSPFLCGFLTAIIYFQWWLFNFWQNSKPERNVVEAIKYGVRRDDYEKKNLECTHMTNKTPFLGVQNLSMFW